MKLQSLIAAAAGFTIVGMSTQAGAVALTAANTPVTVTFDTDSSITATALANTGTNVAAPADLLIGGTGEDGAYDAGTGSSNAGETYSFGAAASNDRAFGSLQSGSAAPILGVVFTNNTGTPITSLSVGYVGEQYRIGVTAARTENDRLDFAYGVGTATLTGTFVDVNSLDLVAPIGSATAAGALDGNAAANQVAVGPQTIDLSATPIASGESFVLRFTDFNASGSDDGLGIDNLQVTAVPEPAALGLLGLGAVGLLGRRRRLA